MSKDFYPVWFNSTDDVIHAYEQELIAKDEARKILLGAVKVELKSA